MNKLNLDHDFEYIYTDHCQSVLRANATARGCPLNPDAEAAFLDLLRSFELALRGLAETNYYLAALDPGLGKTEAVVVFLSAFIAARRRNESALIAVSRKSEIRAYLDRAQISEADFGVLTSDDEMNGWGVGSENAHRAKVLFTTQQMIASRTKSCSFADAECFHYEGQVRGLRVWDESMMPALPIMLRMDTLQGLAEPLRPLEPAFVEALDELVTLVANKKDGEAITVPAGLCELVEAKANLADPDLLSETQRSLREQLTLLAGRPVLIARDNLKGRVLAGCSKRLPQDFAPAVILDASGRVRETYDLWAKYAGGLHRLKSASVDYSRLNVRLWPQAASRNALRNEATLKKIASEIATLINQDCDRWLVIHFKHRKGVADIQSELAGQLSEPTRVSFMHWGDHHGTNKYRDIKKVVVVGSLIYPQSAYISYYLASSGLPIDGLVEQEWRALQWSEAQHNLLQALCRSNVRNSTSGICGPCTAYVIATPAARWKSLIEETFPGCRVASWAPVKPALRGKALALIDCLQAALGDEATRISKSEVRSRLGLGDAAALARLLRRDDVRAELQRLSIAIDAKAFRRAPPTSMADVTLPSASQIWHTEPLTQRCSAIG